MSQLTLRAVDIHGTEYLWLGTAALLQAQGIAPQPVEHSSNREGNMPSTSRKRRRSISQEGVEFVKDQKPAQRHRLELDVDIKPQPLVIEYSDEEDIASLQVSLSA